MEEKKGRCRRKGGKDYWIFVVGSRENVTRKTRQPLLESEEEGREEEEKGHNHFVIRVFGCEGASELWHWG